MVKFDFDPLHTIIIYDEHLHRPIYFRQKGIWYEIKGTCNKCGKCCIKPNKDSYEKCEFLDDNNLCTVEKAKVCGIFPSATPDQYFKEMKDVLINNCTLKITRIGDQ